MGFFKEVLELATDIGGLAVDAGKECSRMKRGWRAVGSAGYSASDTALAAFKQFGSDRKNAVRFMTEDKRLRYDRLAKEYPGGYKDHMGTGTPSKTRLN